MAYSLEWTEAKCDKYDYLMAAFSGAVSGVIDIFFVGAPGMSKLGALTDNAADNLVMKFAKMNGWSPRAGKEGSISSAIGFLEKKFPVNYDHNHTVAVDGAFKMSAANHHYKSLGHSPSIIGLFFSILDQFRGTSSFLSNGALITIKNESSRSLLQGHNLPAKVFSGFCNWLGHLISDLSGSSGGRGKGTGRGSGITIPFMELFQLCNFGKFQVGQDLNTLATVMTKVFQEGYDMRFGAAMAIPVFLNEMMIRAMWVVRQRFFKNKDWKDCVPSEKHADLRIMLIVGYATFCAIDGTDAALKSGGNAVSFVLRLNIIGWARLIALVFKELRIRYGEKVMAALKSFLAEVGLLLTQAERQLLDEYQKRLEKLDLDLHLLLTQLIEALEHEYRLIYQALDDSLNETLSLEERANHSVTLARNCAVPEEKIMKNNDDLDKFFLN